MTPGSDTVAMIYAGGYQPIGHYRAPQASAGTFVTVEGLALVKTGDRCRVRADGKLVLLGRDSTVINTGGEKVYTVEVECLLLEYPGIVDAIVIGLPGPRFGQRVVAVVEGPELSGSRLDIDAFRGWAGERLAGYKLPRTILVAQSLQRAPNGKPDYAFVRRFAQDRV